MNNKTGFLGGLAIVKDYNDKLRDLEEVLDSDFGESFLYNIMDLSVDLLIDKANPNLTRVQHDYFSERIWEAMYSGDGFEEIYQNIIAGDVPEEYIKMYS